MTDDCKANARDLYSQLRYQLAPGLGPNGPCCVCGNPARGGAVCVDCLVAELRVLSVHIDWPLFVRAMRVSQRAVQAAEAAIYWGGETTEAGEG